MKFRFAGRARIAGLALTAACLIPAYVAAQTAPASAQGKKFPQGMVWIRINHSLEQTRMELGFRGESLLRRR